jgi:hypothetical protein
VIDIIFFLLILIIPADLQKAVDDLGNDKYHIRTAATRKLQTSKSEDVIPLLAPALKSESLEVRLRAEMIMEYQWHKIIVGFDRDWAWVSCLPKDFPDREQTITKYNRRKNDDWEDTYFVSEREATRELVFDLLKEGKSKDEIIEMLEKMWKNEDQWTKSGVRRYHLNPPDFEN